jgi:hypothetical protein
MVKEDFLFELEYSGLSRTWMYQQFQFWDEDDVKYYLDHFHKERDEFFFKVAKFREYMIEKNKMSFPEFENAYSIDKRKALERMFQHRVDQTLVEMLEERIKDNVLTLEELYHRHMEQSRLPLHRFVL